MFAIQRGRPMGSPPRPLSLRTRKAILVIGCPRSGTRYTNEVLRQMGLKVEHEKMGRDGTVSSWFAVDDYYYPRAHGGRRADFHFDLVVHQVRHPLDVIGSLETAMNPAWWHWQQAHTGISKESEYPGSRFWLAWNERCEAQPTDLSLRVEAMEDAWPTLSELLFGEERPLPNVSPETGRLRRPNRRAPSWDDLGPYAEPVRKKAAEYGYAV